MNNNIKELMNIKDANVRLFVDNYKNGFLSESALYNLLAENNISIERSNKFKRNNSSKKISIVITTYNRKNLLYSCIKSILRQTYENYEIIVVDDFGSDNTEIFIKKNFIDPRIVYLRNEKNMGVGYSKKRGFLNSSGDVIIFSDDDDYYIDDEFFEKVVNSFESDDIKIVCALSYIKYEKENKYIFCNINLPQGLSTLDYLNNFQVKYLKPPISAIAIRKDCLPLNIVENIIMFNDASIILNALLLDGKVTLLSNAVMIYRFHTMNITNNLSVDFIIENLEEKHKLYMSNKEKFYEKEKWLFDQIYLTSFYYINNSNVSKDNLKKLLMWVHNNFNDRILIKQIQKVYRLSKIKKYIKKLIGRK